jgi:hypothetical protein
MTQLSLKAFQDFCGENGFHPSSLLLENYVKKNLLVPTTIKENTPTFSRSQILIINYLDSYKRPLSQSVVSPDPKMLGRLHYLCELLDELEIIYQTHNSETEIILEEEVEQLRKNELDRKDLKQSLKESSAFLKGRLQGFVDKSDIGKDDLIADLHELRQVLLNSSIFRKHGRTVPYAKEYIRFIPDSVLKKAYAMEMTYLVNLTLSCLGEELIPLVHHIRGRRCICCGKPIEITRHDRLACTQKKCSNFADQIRKRTSSNKETRRNLESIKQT